MPVGRTLSESHLFSRYRIIQDQKCRLANHYGYRLFEQSPNSGLSPAPLTSPQESDLEEIYMGLHHFHRSGSNLLTRSESSRSCQAGTRLEPFKMISRNSKGWKILRKPHCAQFWLRKMIKRFLKMPVMGQIATGSNCGKFCLRLNQGTRVRPYLNILPALTH